MGFLEPLKRNKHQFLEVYFNFFQETNINVILYIEIILINTM